MQTKFLLLTSKLLLRLPTWPPHEVHSSNGYSLDPLPLLVLESRLINIYIAEGDCVPEIPYLPLGHPYLKRTNLNPNVLTF